MSKELYRLSGKKLEVPPPAEGWTFERRPGGWCLATHVSGLRKRFFLDETRGKLSFSIDGFLYHGPIEVVSRGGGKGAGSDQDLVAQFPGKVRKVLVAEGDRVSEGDPLLLLEAMKMEFSVKAPFSGRISKLKVKEGQQLSPGDRFLDLDREENPS